MKEGRRRRSHGTLKRKNILYIRQGEEDEEVERKIRRQ